jgi:hypothetical protein
MDPKLIALLQAVGAVPEGQYFNTAKAMKEAETAGMVEGNTAIKNPANKNEYAWRLTEAGKHQLTVAGDGESNDDDAEVSDFVIADVAIPPVSRLNSGQSKYPFDKLGNGQSFFIPAPPDMKSPSKSFGSMVSAANKKYGDPGEGKDFRRFTTRSVMGDAWGKKGVRGVAVFRESAEDEAKSRANAKK